MTRFAQATCLAIVILLAGCDAPTSSETTPNPSFSETQSQTPEFQFQYAVTGPQSAGQLNGTSKSQTKSSSTLDTLDVETQYDLAGTFFTSGSGNFSVSPPTTSDPGDVSWNTAPQTPEKVVSPEVEFSPSSVTFDQSGTSVQETLSQEFESALNDAANDLQSANDAIEEENVSSPDGDGPERLEPTTNSMRGRTQSAEEAATQKHAPPPGQTIKFFKKQGYDVKGLGQGRLQLTREMSFHSGQTKVEHVYDVRQRQILRTRQYRNGQIVAKHRVKTQNGERRMVTTHFDKNGKPHERSSMIPGQ